MSVKKIVFGLLGIMLNSTLHAEVPINVLASCKAESAYDINVTMTEMKEGAFSDEASDDCDDNYEVDFENKAYGYKECKNASYITSGKDQINISNVKNMSIHPGIKPGYLIPHHSRWWKINDKKNDYLCIAGPVSLSGKGNLHTLYYIIENAFNEGTMTGQFMYFDKPGQDE
jgi:hypothetical protein